MVRYYGMKLVIEAKGYEYYPEVLKGVELSEEDAALSPDEKMRHATELILSNDYYELKDTIRTNMKRSLKEIERLTREEKEASQNALQMETNIVRIIILLQTIGFLAVVWVTSRLVSPVLAHPRSTRFGIPDTSILPKGLSQQANCSMLPGSEQEDMLLFIQFKNLNLVSFERSNSVNSLNPTFMDTSLGAPEKSMLLIRLLSQ